MICILFILIFIGAVNIAAQAQEVSRKLYIRGGVGVAIPANIFKETMQDYYIKRRPKTIVLYNAGIGYTINSICRVDLNFYYRNLRYRASELDGTYDTIREKAKLYSVFLNGYFDLNFHKIVKPYLTAGIGYSHNNSSNAHFVMKGVEILTEEFPGKKTNNFAWNIGAGTRFILSNKFSLDTSYRYVVLGKITIKEGLVNPEILGKTQRVTYHDVMVGVIVNL